ncbi:helix-turn-helix transcriptional regulator [Lacrimispora defluvii]|uniref:YafY family transcriptional regulator n=1 Tax=Lacrimispora defluvii TaxID=2719233 RepID=A0ABX1VWV4_9FIRM|nr:YafY family protein [Lacrimispora defluvii]NNJ30856.1 YafY family transcriptional regulator [Lacrimispora defluvii]
MKENRLFKIIYFILEKGRVTAPELAEKFEVSVRTIYRDIDVISSAGIPIYVTTGRSGGIQILDNYVLDKALFSDKEKHDILSSLQSLSVIDNTCERELLTKLSALFNTQPENWVEVDFSRWGSKTQDNTKFEQLKNAAINHKVATIVYVSSCFKKTRRNIHPLKLYYKSKEWYVKAYCTEKNDFRLFKINRIIHCEILDEDFIPVEFPELQDTEQNGYNKIILRFPKEMAYRVYDEFTEDEITEQENGDFIAAAYMPEDTWLIGYLLSYGVYVEVIEPAYLRKVLSDEAKKIYEKYKP